MNKAPEKRFWERVETSGNCWSWQGATNGDGYGTFWAYGRVGLTHRFVYSSLYGHIPNGLCVCHYCDNPKCVRPSHLFIATHKENMYDAIVKGRLDNRGEKNGESRLNENDIHEMRRIYSLGGITQATLGKMWGISNQHVSDIVRGKSWGHI